MAGNEPCLQSTGGYLLCTVECPLLVTWTWSWSDKVRLYMHSQTFRLLHEVNEKSVMKLNITCKAFTASGNENHQLCAMIGITILSVLLPVWSKWQILLHFSSCACQTMSQDDCYKSHIFFKRPVEWNAALQILPPLWVMVHAMDMIPTHGRLFKPSHKFSNLYLTDTHSEFDSDLTYSCVNSVELCRC